MSRTAAENGSDPTAAEGGGAGRVVSCPYLVASSGNDPSARCLAGERAVVLADLQVALVCRSDLHAECPRFRLAIRRGRRVPSPAAAKPAEPGRDALLGEARAAAGARVVRLGASVRELPSARLAAVVVLALAVALAAAGSLRPGGLTIAGLGGSPTPGSPGEPSPLASPSPAAPSPSPEPSPSPSPEPSPSPSPEPSPSPMPSPSPSPPVSSPGPSPSPTSDRYALLEPCPDRPDCYVYTVRQGDNLWSIGNYFGVPLATIYDLNPWARTSGLRAGQQLILPPPTR